MKRPRLHLVLRLAAGMASLMVFLANSLTAQSIPVAILCVCLLALVADEGREGGVWVGAGISILLAVTSSFMAHDGSRDLGGALTAAFVIVAIVLTAALQISRHKLQAARVQLRESEAELTTFADSVPQMLWRSTADGRMDFVNRRFTELTGVDQADVVSRQSWVHCIHPDDLGPLKQKLDHAQKTGEDISHLVRLRHIDGNYRWMSMAKRAVRSAENGEVLRWYGGSTDVHEEMLAQQKVRDLMATLERRVDERTSELMQTEARYAGLFEVSNITFAEMDFSETAPLLAELRDNGVVDLRAFMADHPDVLEQCLANIRTTRVNEALVRLMGYDSVAELTTNPPAQDANDGPEVLLRQLEMAYYGSDHIDGRTILIGKGGHRIPVYYTVNRLSDGLHLSSYVDLSEQEHIEEMRRAAQGELARANRIATIGAYSATIAHELNQPIASMRMDVETSIRWLDNEEPNLAAVKRGLERLARTTERVANIVARTKASVTAHRHNPMIIDLHSLAMETRDLMKRELERASALLEVNCDSEFPPIEADPVELQQVLVNLLVNAAEAMHDTQGVRRIEMSILKRADGVHVSVADSGPGIPQERIERLFEPFFTTKPAGIGLGLQICRSAVQAMGSTLAVRNRDEGGAEFSFVLPFAASPHSRE